MAITERLRARALRASAVVTLLRLALAATFVLTLFVTQSSTASAATACKSSGYACTLDGYNATTMNDSWAAKYYGSDTKDGIGTPHTTARCSPRGCSRTTDCPIPGTRGATPISGVSRWRPRRIRPRPWARSPGTTVREWVTCLRRARRLVKSHGIPRVGQLRRRQ